MGWAVAEPDSEYWAAYSNLQRVKHDLIRRYLNGWFPKLILGGARRVLYFDTHAGRGKHKRGQLGSPLVALTTLLEHRSCDRMLRASEVQFIFVEKDERNLEQLKGELKACEPLPMNVLVRPVCGDCFQILENLISSRQVGGPWLASFVFCDPYGFGIPGRTLRRLMQFPRVELFVNVMWRELGMAIAQGDKRGMAARLDSVFDGPEWRDAVVSMGYDERAEQCVQLLRRKTGAKWATYIRMLGPNNVTRYFLMHLTKNDAGRDLMKECIWQACPDGGYYARRTDDPKQQYLITPEPDLGPLREWVAAKLAQGPQRWQQLAADVREEIWLTKHLNQVVCALRRERAIVGEDYEGKFALANNPLLRLAGK